MHISLNPCSEVELLCLESHDDLFVRNALDEAVGAQRTWRRSTVEQRAELLRAIARILRCDAANYAALITSEMGKPIAEAESEIEKSALNCEFYAINARTFLAEETVAMEPADSVVAYDPMGVLLAIMPWNYPFWQFFRFAAPALAAGNGIVLKHANNVPQCALAVEDILQRAGAPRGLVRTLLIEPDKVSAIIADDRIAAVTMTGSTQVGSLVAAQAGQALKKQVLELGGSDPFIVLADADVDLAARMAVKARFVNSGQSCVNAKRFIVMGNVAQNFVAAFAANVERLVTGDPMNRATQVGPLARAGIRDVLMRQVDETVRQGGVLVTGGRRLERTGFFYAPTILDHVTAEMTAAQEELFGPVASIIRVSDEAEAIRVANETVYGLGASIWTRNQGRGYEIAREIDAGVVAINTIVASDPRLPFGGTKKSGYGRELGIAGIREFANVKTIMNSNGSVKK